jgi:hypothetical protein
MPPARQGSHPPEEPLVVEKAPSETEGKWGWSFSGIIKELRRRHKVKRISDAPGVRQSILAILKTSCETFTSCRRRALPLSNRLAVRSRVKRATYLYTAFCARSLPSSGGSWALITLVVDFPLSQTQQYPDFRL